MGLSEAGIRELRENLAHCLWQGAKPVAMTRHGDTGGYLAARRRRSEAERARRKEAAARLRRWLPGEGMTGDEIMADPQRWRAEGRK